MHRRMFLKTGLTATLAAPAAVRMHLQKFPSATAVLEKAVAEGQVHAAAIAVWHRGDLHSQSFGAAKSAEAIFLLASISKPMSVVALMTLFDQSRFELDDRVSKFLPEFAGDARDRVTIRHLLTHVSGLPDQLPRNADLRRRQAPLSEFVQSALQTPLLFEPGTQYRYSSMAILLAGEIAERLSGLRLSQLMDQSVFQPLQMRHSALGSATISLDQTMRCQTVSAAPESGGGDALANAWDWNSVYWRQLGAPWGGVLASAPDVVRFFRELLHPSGRVIKERTVRLILRNHNPPGFTAHGLGMAVGTRVGGTGCSERTFGHTGSTGTLVWADPETDTICVVLTTLPADAVSPHPRRLVSDLVAEAVKHRPD